MKKRSGAPLASRGPLNAPTEPGTYTGDPTNTPECATTRGGKSLVSAQNTYSKDDTRRDQRFKRDAEAF
jgi:hypothetical protein